MNNLLIKLEKSKSFWFLLSITIVFFILRLPSLIEPNWYGDEGIYQVIGMAIDNGRLLYTEAWDNKPPLLYLTYALFGGDQFAVRMAALVAGLASVWLFYFLTSKLFTKHYVSVTATSIFAVLFGIPLLEGNIANAENFMLLPIIAAALIIFSKTKKTKALTMLGAGLLLGVAFLFKIVAVFDFAAFFLFLFCLNWPIHKNEKTKRWQWDIIQGNTLFSDATTLILGFALPLLIAIIYFATNNALPEFFQAAFLGNVGYVGYGNTFFIPQGLLILKTSLLVAFVALICWQRKRMSTSAFFIILWTAFSLYNALFSQRPYTHYVLVFLPAFCLLIGLVLQEQKIKKRTLFISIGIAAVIITLSNFKLYSFKKTFLYYQNAFLFITNQKDVKEYQAFFDGKTPRDYQVAAFLKMHTKPNDPVFVWGDNSQIYSLSYTLPINQYTVAYHITQNKSGVKDTQKAIDTVKPTYVVILEESPTFPFRLPQYSAKYTLDRAIVYEKDF